MLKQTVINMMLLILTCLLILTICVFYQYPKFEGNDTYELASNIDAWVRYNPDGANISYEFHELPQSPDDTMYSRKGDCTDIALLTVMLLKSYDIDARLVSGYGDGMSHAWYEFKNFYQIPNDDPFRNRFIKRNDYVWTWRWETFENMYFENLTIIEYDKVW